MHRTQNLIPLFRASAVALACLAAGGAAQAQSSVTAYGLFDVSAGQFQNAGSLKVKRLDSGNLATSYIGFKGSEDLGGGLRANFQLESFFLGDTGGASRVPGVDSFWGRNANVSLSGGFGTVKLGRQAAPLFVSTLLFNSFADAFGYSPTIRQWYAPVTNYATPVIGDTAWSNAIGYSTPDFKGLSANVVVNAGEGAATAKGHNVGANVLYFGGPFALTAAWQSVKNTGALGRPIAAFPGFTEQTSYQVGASYNFGPIKVFAQYGEVDTSATLEVKSKIGNVSASIPVGAGSILLAYGEAKRTTAGSPVTQKSDMGTLGYDYFLSKRTDIYAIVMGDKLTGFANGTTYAVGMKHTF